MTTTATVTLFGGWFSVVAAYDHRLVAGLKSIGGKWDGRERRWLVPQHRCASLHAGLVSLYGAAGVSWCGQ